MWSFQVKELLKTKPRWQWEETCFSSNPFKVNGGWVRVLRFRDMFSTTHFKTLNIINHFSVQDINSERSEFRMLAEITGSSTYWINIMSSAKRWMSEIMSWLMSSIWTKKREGPSMELIYTYDMMWHLSTIPRHASTSLITHRGVTTSEITVT